MEIKDTVIGFALLVSCRCWRTKPLTRCKEITTGQCNASDICVDGPYKPPNPMLIGNLRDKHNGTAHCVSKDYLARLSEGELKWCRLEQKLAEEEKALHEAWNDADGAGAI